MLIEKLNDRFGAAILKTETANGDESITIARGTALEIFKSLRDESGFEFNVLVDLTAVDWLERKPRFDVIYHLNSLTLVHRLRVKIAVEYPQPWAFSATPLWKSADWLERECFDMFGIVFKGHPDLRRILLYDTFEGHPLRKDYPYNKRQPIVPEIDPIANPLRSSR
ncbi:MAG: NADH-quinone oxidoreductase subunit C [Candidatus Binatus sp.]|uniref:NADH-quinone oxidoreductase subunit C n=1 Tax=Candidatus Binatus sp. TaxID=2811406 RepID=UPI00271CB876|nr:NADH-quinone oxidoreductase subunit C [Candidatus Binatus sp.]MDO8431989.1 NADH-quinone oxidoreductase subunit C [Candidatus Binatus sp.]